MKKILIVDDSYVARLYLESLLEGQGYALAQAEDGQVALEMMEYEPPHAMIIDLLMPRMTGLQLLEALQDYKNRPEVIVVSADIQESTRQRCQELGAKAFLSKPVMQGELLKKVNQLFNS
ncbi:response regulator [Carboxylicivirga sp. RSCT41]|uniref:response regulator n=1 Tax=Carboxylicivirga agarovorans TaxID=3417570 RepID=UPI003D339166